MWKAIVGIAVGSLVTACGDVTQVDPIDEVLGLTGSASSGQAVYDADCAGCHGADGLGGTGPSLADEVPEHEDRGLVDVVMHGEGSMSARSSLSHQDISDVVAYLRDEFGAFDDEGDGHGHSH